MSISINLHHQFPELTLDVDFDAPAGVTALFGASGSGKTTVVNAVAGLLQPDRGRISVAGTALLDTSAGLRLPPHKRRIGYVFQEGRLFPHLSVQQNLRYGRWFAGLRGPSAAEDHLVEMLGLGDLLNRRPGDLSGGEKQRVAIGRALLSEPRLLLMDEPLAALDGPRKAEILPYLERLRDETQVPILYVSHAISEIARLATTVAVMERGQLCKAGPTGDILADPSLAHAIGLRDTGALLTGRVVAHHMDGLSELAAGGGKLFLPKVPNALGEQLRVRISAKDVMLSRDRPVGISALNILECEVSEIRPGRGPGAFVRLKAGGDHILARVTKRSVDALGLAPGLPCYAVIKTVSVARADVGADVGAEASSDHAEGVD
ncbi:molybdenum ABC transporter ATP-binding protein [Thalassovita sp.]|uniref:molybdenum ABC transporter ATP-binding protein n=1 Tax=Thalassovita sp. TaxID=1979401 RepID=UPI002AAF49CC|nr:molybdenum ABC transporter ATP-binding protein [Thalassovita sp.]